MTATRTMTGTSNAWVRVVVTALVVALSGVGARSYGSASGASAGQGAQPAAAAQPLAASTRLPRVHVTIRGRVPLEEKRAARISVRKQGVTVFRGRIGIELRGKSSLRFPKKPYGSYRGVYVLMEKLKLHEDRVDKPEPAQLLEWSSWEKRKGADFRLPGANVPILFDGPERSELSMKRREAVRRSLVAADAALYRAGFADPDSGWRRHLDEASAVDFVLLNEVFKNQEAFNTSTYLARGKREKWTLGPLWDVDLSMGNFSYGPASRLAGPMLAERDWAKRLYADPAFVAAVAARWQELRAAGLREALLTDVATIAGRLVATGAAAHNFRRWPVLGKVIWPNPPDAANRPTYASEVRALTAWLKTCMAWLDAHIHQLGGRLLARAGGTR